MNKLTGNLYTVCYGCIKINAVVRPFSNRMCFIGKTQQIVPNFHVFISIETTRRFPASSTIWQSLLLGDFRQARKSRLMLICLINTTNSFSYYLPDQMLSWQSFFTIHSHICICHFWKCFCHIECSLLYLNSTFILSINGVCFILRNSFDRLLLNKCVSDKIYLQFKMYLLVLVTALI